MSTSARTHLFQHPRLGGIVGRLLSRDLVQYCSLPYASIPQRFSRASLLDALPSKPYDAAKPGPTSVQPFGSVEKDAKGNQLPTEGLQEEEQAEDCLTLNVFAPVAASPDQKVPVLCFIHGGAFFLGSSTRPYYHPQSFCEQAITSKKPLIFVSINYRLGGLGFFHSPEASDLIPANNGLHDQLRALEWIRSNISGFGGDPSNLTVIGQSAGGESVSLHNYSGSSVPLYKRAIAFSGSPVTMPSKTPQEHQENFVQQAKKLEIEIEGKSSTEIAQEMIKVDVSKIRDLAFVGAPCSSSEILPYDKPTMQNVLDGTLKTPDWLESQIVSSASYDGSISYIMTQGDDSKKDYAKSFHKVAEDVLKNPQALYDLYDMKASDDDQTALTKICQFESDIGFFSAAYSMAEALPSKTFFQHFDLANPFEGPLGKDKGASHTWDIVALLGAYEEKLRPELIEVIRDWREKIIDYVVDGTPPCAVFGEERNALLVTQKEVKEATREDYLDGRRAKLLELADKEGGRDLVWEGLCRRWLMKGE